MAFLIIRTPHMAAIFGQFPANFRFSGGLGADTLTDKHADTHINTMTRPGLGAGPSEN